MSTTSRKLDSIRQNDTIMKEDKFKNGEKEDGWELTASHLLSFAWQIASGMVRTLSRTRFIVVIDILFRNTWLESILFIVTWPVEMFSSAKTISSKYLTLD